MHILTCTNPCIPHNRRTTSRLYLSIITTFYAGCRPVMRVISSHLVSNFVRYIIYIKRVTCWISSSCHSAPFISRVTYTTNTTCISATVGIKIMTNIVIFIPNISINYLLCFVIIFSIKRVCSWIIIHNIKVIRYKLICYSQLLFINTIHTRHGDHHLRQYI